MKKQGFRTGAKVIHSLGFTGTVGGMDRTGNWVCVNVDKTKKIPPGKRWYATCDLKLISKLDKVLE